LSGKRLFDLLTAAVGGIALAPFAAVIAAVIRWKLGSPVLFRQQRPGLHGRPFELLKFRTMNDARGPDGELLPDEERLTGFGQVLRSSSLDELPELWNVVCGDMSLVGPRPLLMEYLPRYTPRQARRHEVRPGITGWAQVKGRNAPEWEDRLEMDVWYVENRRFLLDVRILLRTVIAVLRREGIVREGHATVPKFEPLSNEGGRSVSGGAF
jgi:sugar transferase EpsL